MPTALLMAPLINRVLHDDLLANVRLFEEIPKSKASERKKSCFWESAACNVTEFFLNEQLLPDLILTSASSPDAQETAKLLQAEIAKHAGRNIPHKADAGILRERIVESAYSSVESLLGALASLDKDNAFDLNPTQRAEVLYKIRHLENNADLNIFDAVKDYITPCPKVETQGVPPEITLVIVGESLAQKTLWALALPEVTKNITKIGDPGQVFVIRGGDCWRKLATSGANSLRRLAIE